MAGSMDGTEEAALWQRWRASHAATQATGAALDPMLLAAYAEDRLSPEGAAEVEAWLADNPEAIQDVLEARRALRQHPAVAEAVIARAAALVGESDAEVVSFAPRRHASTWRAAAAWGAMAASVLVTSLAGFAMGSDAYVSVASLSGRSASQDLFEPPSGLFYSFDEDSSI